MRIYIQFLARNTVRPDIEKLSSLKNFLDEIVLSSSLQRHLTKLLRFFFGQDSSDGGFSSDWL